MLNRTGIDISSHQGTINFYKVHDDIQGIKFCMVKLGNATPAGLVVSNVFEEYVKGCEDNGIPWGCYVYSYVTTNTEAKTCAEETVAYLNGRSTCPEYPIAFDFEEQMYQSYTKNACTQLCDIFLETIEDGGYYAMLYATLDYLRNRFIKNSLKRYDKWVAQWNDLCTYGEPFGMWQFTNKGLISGINVAVDMNKAYNDYPTIIKAAGLNGWSTEYPTLATDCICNECLAIISRRVRKWIREKGL